MTRKRRPKSGQAKIRREAAIRGWQIRRARERARLLHLAGVIMKNTGSAGGAITAPIEKPRNQGTGFRNVY